VTPPFVRYPFSRRFTLARGAGRRARRVRLLAGASDWRRDLLDRAGSAAVGIVGTRPWPTAVAWPWPPHRPTELVERLHDTLPGLHIVAAAAPRQTGRTRLSVLGTWRGADVVIKLGRPGDGIETEVAALRLLEQDPLPSIATPSVIAAGHLEDGERIAYLATEALGLDGQRPAIDEPLYTFEADLAERLRALPRPSGSHPDDIPTHGDLAPWNLRRTGRGLALFDWEDAAWRPPGSDLAHYRRTCDELRRR
jgi:hypothetical protein